MRPRLLKARPFEFVAEKRNDIAIMTKPLCLCGLSGLLAALLFLPAAAGGPRQEAGGSEAVAIFDGESLEGWHGIGTVDPRALVSMNPGERQSRIDAWTQEARRHWKAEEGVLVSDGTGPFLATDKHYGDFELELEYAIAPGADSGVYLRGSPQVQIWDHTDESKFAAGADKGSGGLWNNTPGEPSRFPLVVADNPPGEWNKLRVIMVGSYVTVWLNDQLVVDHAIFENLYDSRRPEGERRPVLREGSIILQTHGGETRWRNITLRDIAPAEANALLANGGPERGKEMEAGWQSLFNGEDFTGWRGPTDDNGIEDGAILSRHGAIYTEETFDDFKVRFEFQLPERGNNGLAIRYPGQGDPAYEGMCELQVLDTPSYGGQIHPQQAHGSAYGMVAAHQGYLRPVGQWNYQEVTVKGSTIRVELNGFVILDTDLASVADPMHPIENFTGRTRTQGHFGFAGHGDPVKYRNIHIRRL